MKGDKKEGGMMSKESGKGKMSKESERGRRKTRAHGEPEDEPDDDEEYEYVCPDSAPKGKDKASTKGMMGKGGSAEEDEGIEEMGVKALKDKAPLKEKKKEPKRLRFQL